MVLLIKTYEILYYCPTWWSTHSLVWLVECYEIWITTLNMDAYRLDESYESYD